MNRTFENLTNRKIPTSQSPVGRVPNGLPRGMPQGSLELNGVYVMNVDG